MLRTCPPPWACAALLLAAATVSGQTTLRKEGGRVVLENASLRAVIDPGKGARLESLTLRTAADRIEIVTGPSVIEGVVPSGDRTAWLAETNFRETGAEKNRVRFETALPKVESPGKPGNDVELLYYPDPDYSTVRMEKSYFLPDRAAALAVEYRLTNTGRAAMTLCLALQQQFGDAKGRRGEYWFPGLRGAQSHPDRRARGDVTSLADGWIAVMSERGIGAVRWIAPNQLTGFRLSHDGTRRTEAFSIQATIPPGGSWDFGTAVIPFSGMKRLSATTPLGLAGLTVDPPPAPPTPPPATAPAAAKGAATPTTTLRPADAAVYQPRQRIGGQANFAAVAEVNVSLEITARRLPEGAEEKVAARGVAPLGPGQTLTYPFTFAPREPGTWLVTLNVTDGQQSVGSAQHEIVVGQPSGTAPALPAITRQGPPYRPLQKAWPPPVDYRPLMDIPSHHLPHARPHAQGPVRALFLYPFWTAREVVELAQRVEMDYDFAGMGIELTRQKGAFQRSYDEKSPAPEAEASHAAELLSRPHDVIVAAHSWSYWPEEVRAEVLRQVRTEGVGLVCLYLEGADATLAALEKAARTTPTRFVEGEARSAEFGKGRVIFYGLGQRMDVTRGYAHHPFGPEALPYERVAQGLLWAARREPRVDLTCSMPQGEIPHGGGKAAAFFLTNRTAEPFQGRLEVVVRQALHAQYRLIYGFWDQYGTPHPWEERHRSARDIAAPAGAPQKIEEPLPPLPAGSYLLCATLRDGQGRVINWRTTPFRVTAAAPAPELYLSKAGGAPVRADYPGPETPREEGGRRLPQIGFKPTETLVAKVVARTDGLTAPSATLRLADGDGRVLFDQRKGLDARGEAVFTAPLSHALHYALIATATVWSEKQAVTETRALIPIHRYPERDDKYRFTQLDNECWQPFRHIGITEYNNGASWDRSVLCAVQDVLFQAFGGEVPKGRLGANNVLEFCFNNPDQVKKQIEAAQRNVRYVTQFAPQGRLFVDEYRYGGHQACQCDFCQKAYREYLKRAYGTVQRLNDSWGVAFRSFDEATLYLLPDREPVPRKDWPRALDTCTWKTVQMTDYCLAIAKAGKAVSPDAEFGFSGAYKMSLTSGNDFWHCSQVGKYHIMYRDWNEWASMAGAESVRLWRWYWRKYNPSEQRRLAWECLLRGEPGTGIYTCENYPSCYPDGRLMAGPKAYFEEFHEINRGPARLLLGHEARDGIAIHWSSPSFTVYALERWEAIAKQGKDPKKDDMMDWPRRTAHLIEGASAGPHSLAAYYVAHGQLEKGSLGLWGRPKIIFLTYSPAMSAQEAQTLRKFVQEGGTLVGQVNPAVYDDHGRLLGAGQLDDVFGVRRSNPAAPALISTGRAPGAPPPTDRRGAPLPAPRDGVQLTWTRGTGDALTAYPLVLAPANVQATTAKAYGEYTAEGARMPAMYVNSFGKGRAIHLNFLLTGSNEITGDEVNEETGKAFARIVQALVEMAGVKPWATVTGAMEQGRIRLNRFEDGDNVYLGALAPHGESPAWYAALKTQVTLSEARHVYDVRAGKYLGRTTQIEPVFANDATARLYACLPYRATGLDVIPPARAQARGDVVVFNITLRADGRPGRHVFRVEVWNPAGESVPKYNYNFEAPAGTGAGRVFLALNDPPGEWRVRCTDTATGLSAEVKFTVTP